MPPLTREVLTSLPTSYFEAVDAKNLPAVLAHFTPDATLTVQTARFTFTGTKEIHNMFSTYLSGSGHDEFKHVITSTVVDEERGKVATELDYYNENGVMHNCNFFEVGEDGRFTRVVIWMDGESPLRGNWSSSSCLF